MYNYNAALSAKIERRKVNIMKQRKRFRKGIITFMLLIALVTVQVVQVTALASEEGQSVQVSTWDDLLAAVIASQEGDVIEVMDEITIPSGIALNPNNRITIKRGTADASLRNAWNSDTSVKNTFENIDFDGGEISSLNTMIELNSSADFTNCLVKNCFTNSSAVTISNGEASFNGCTFSQNKGNSGSHIGIQTNSKVTIQNCIFTGGQSGNLGGAICMTLDNCNVEITGSTITGNSASNVGGAIYNRGTLTVASSKIYGNTAAKGADIYSAVPITIETQVTDLEQVLILLTRVVQWQVITHQPTIQATAPQTTVPTIALQAPMQTHHQQTAVRPQPIQGTQQLTTEEQNLLTITVPQHTTIIRPNRHQFSSHRCSQNRQKNLSS